MKITNTSNGPRGFHSAHGEVLLSAGESWEGELSDGEAASAKGTGYFSLSGGKSGKADSAPKAEDIVNAIALLDPKNDAHWTQAGLPEVAAVKEALGADVTRAQIEAAAPDAKRPTE